MVNGRWPTVIILPVIEHEFYICCMVTQKFNTQIVTCPFIPKLISFSWRTIFTILPHCSPTTISITGTLNTASTESDTSTAVTMTTTDYTTPTTIAQPSSSYCSHCSITCVLSALYITTVEDSSITYCNTITHFDGSCLVATSLAL